MKRNYMAGIRFSVIVPSFNKADYIFVTKKPLNLPGR